ncbi:uncharacterized protein [Nicotiana tomentosiformis]|uniref:uncharacterized protein n=1 Tax=Nicotiana tomentosiformis TaxID=4098 RepID=UPI00051C2272|nr:uncharacterized protein LOC104104934 [Nicotiana tomentosiformis]
MAKVRVEVDLSKPKLNSVWVGQEKELNSLKGFTQKLEYENVPKYCRHYKLLGHSLATCRNVHKKNNAEVKEGAEHMNLVADHTTDNNSNAKPRVEKKNEIKEKSRVNERQGKNAQVPSEMHTIWEEGGTSKRDKKVNSMKHIRQESATVNVEIQHKNTGKKKNKNKETFEGETMDVVEIRNDLISNKAENEELEKHSKEAQYCNEGDTNIKIRTSSKNKKIKNIKKTP